MAITTFADMDKLRRDQLILGASRFMCSGGRETSAQFFGQNSKAVPAEGNGDTVIPAGKPLGTIIDGVRDVDVRAAFDDVARRTFDRLDEDFSKCSPPPSWNPDGKLAAYQIPRWNRKEPIPELPVRPIKFDGSIPPGISTDPFKPVVDATPDTPRQQLRTATIKAIAANLDIITALDKLERYERMTP